MNQKSLFIAVSLIALLAIAGALWCIQKRQVTTNQPIAADSVVNPIQDPLKTPKSYPQHIEAIPGNMDEVWYNIPELGIRMKLNKEFAEDLIYAYFSEKDDEGKEWDRIGFSTKALAAITEYCNPGALWSVDRIKVSLKQEIEKNSFTTRHLNDYVQAGNYYYGFEGSHDPCWNQDLESEVREVFPGKYPGLGAKNILDSLKTIQTMP